MIDIDEHIANKHYRQINSVLLYKNESIVTEKYYNGYSKDSRNVIRSVSKSILSIAVGICLDKGLIHDLNTPVYRYLPEFGMGLSPYHKAITIRHLLTMTSGIYWTGGVHYHCPLMTELRRSDDWVMHIAQTAVTDVPGTKYNYKEFDVILLAVLLEKAIGSDLFDFMKENLFDPLDIRTGRWWKSPCGATYSVADAGAGNGGERERTSNLTAREMLSVGRLFLQKGIFNGNRILSEDYISQAITPSRHNPGYGYLWWIGDNWYGCHGYGGQNITVFPEDGAIAVIQATPTSRGMEYEDVVSKLIEE